MKIKLKPTPQQKKIINNWFGTARYVYNKALNYVETNKIFPNYFELRNKFVTKIQKWGICNTCNTEYYPLPKEKRCCGNLLTLIERKNENTKDFEHETPKEIRANAIKDLVNGRKTAHKLLKNKIITHFKMRFRSKKETQSIVIQKQSIKFVNNKFVIYPKSLSPIEIGRRTKKKLTNLRIEHDCRLSFKNGNYYIHVPISTTCKQTVSGDRIIALDPGVRKFFVGYSENEIVQISRKDNIIKRLTRKIDLLASLKSKHKLRNKKKLSKYRTKLTNYIDDLHWKTINYLTKNYDIILLPKFESQKLATRSRNHNLNRNLGIMKQYTFQQRLLNKANECSISVYLVGEEYTTKTCTRCGIINDPGSNETYSCNSCNLVIDRDINGARNIFIKNVEIRSS